MSICFVGDELVAGVGDPRVLGWVGRVMARTDTPQSAYSLAVPRETTTALSARWETESARRFTGDEDYLVLQLGAHDLVQGLSMARSRLNLANILDDAAGRHLPAYVVGPPPRTDIDETDIGELSEAFADVCRRRRVPYTDLFSPLVDHNQWLTDQATGDGVHPGQAGYGLISWLVLHNGWHQWLGATERVS